MLEAIRRLDANVLHVGKLVVEERRLRDEEGRALALSTIVQHEPGQAEGERVRGRVG